MKKRANHPKPDTIQDKFDKMGLGTEEQRQYYRRYEDADTPKKKTFYTLRWSTDERDLALAQLEDR